MPQLYDNSGVDQSVAQAAQAGYASFPAINAAVQPGVGDNPPAWLASLEAWIKAHPTATVVVAGVTLFAVVSKGRF